jgi:dihydroneopterin aldolase
MVITLHSIKLFAHHGAYESERAHGNNFEIDLSVEIEMPPACESDLLEDTVDYTSIVDIIYRVSAAKQYVTIEAFAYDICNAILKRDSRIESVAIDLKKLKPPTEGDIESAGVSFILSR